MHYTNPIIPLSPGKRGTGDPYVLRHNGYYYHCFNMKDGVYLTKSKSLTDIGKDTPVNVFPHPEEGVGSGWFAPELHFIDGAWYIYSSPCINEKGTHAMRVLKYTGSDPIGQYELLGGITGIGDKWSIDGTVMELDGKLYFIWTSNYIYISEMLSPTQVSDKQVSIIEAEYDWEKVMQPITEGPAVLKHDGKTFIVYSASDSRSDGYCLGLLTYLGGDPLEKSSWQKHSTPLLSSANGVYGPGHCSFTKVELNGKDEDFIVYHANLEAGSGWLGRHVWTQRVEWKDDIPFIGSPMVDCNY